jgi:hypothetical protein
MRRPFALAVAIALVATVACVHFARAGAAGDATRFRTPDAGAACKVEGTALVCSSLGAERSVALRAGRPPAVVSRLPWWDASTPVLTTWRHGSLSCSLDDGTIVCQDGGVTLVVAGDGFAVAA